MGWRAILFWVVAALMVATSSVRAQDGQRGALSVAVAASEVMGAPKAQEQVYAKSYALVIGNNAYRSTSAWPKLSNAVVDAREIKTALERHGFTVTLETDLDYAGLDAALRNFFFRVGADKDARLLLWYVGHGHTVGEEGFLVPVDAPAASAGFAFRETVVPMRRFSEYMRAAESKHVLAVFDSCFSGTVFDNARSPPPAVISRATTQPVRQMISSGEANQGVSDNGKFRDLFIAALDGKEPNADANRDGFITGTELGLFLSDRYADLTRNRQTPRYGKLRELGYDRGDFVFKAGLISGPDRPRSTSASATASPPNYLQYVDAFEAGQPILRDLPFTRDEMGRLSFSILDNTIAKLKSTKWQGGTGWGNVSFDDTGQRATYTNDTTGAPGRLLLTGVFGDAGNYQGSMRSAVIEPILIGEWYQSDGRGGFILKFERDQIKLLWGPRFLRESIWRKELTSARPQPDTAREGQLLGKGLGAGPKEAAQPAAPVGGSTSAQTYSLTIPDGLTTSQLLNWLGSRPQFSGAVVGQLEEGRFLPGTYNVSSSDSLVTILDQMRAGHSALVKSAWETRSPNLPYKTVEEAIVLASIVEKEVGQGSEHARVAAVFVNRLRQGIRLQSDPTVRFGLFGGTVDWAHRLTASDLKSATPFNTYSVNGLPPTPICNPSRKSILAALQPSNTNDLYFVADGRGGLVFSAFLQDHHKAVRKLRESQQKK